MTVTTVSCATSLVARASCGPASSSPRSVTGASGVEVRARGPLGGRLAPLTARVALVTLPLGVLKARPPARGAVRFVPPLPREKRRAIAALGMGRVIEVILRFRHPLGVGALGALPPDASFLHLAAGSPPTWWVPRPLSDSVLVGWVAGPRAEALREPARHP